MSRTAAVLTLSRGPAAVPVARRVVGALAARADLHVDRLEDAVLAAETLAVHATARGGGRVRFEIEAGDGELSIQVGPLPEGAARRLVEDATVDGVGDVLGRLADECAVRPAAEGEEVLALVIRV